MCILDSICDLRRNGCRPSSGSNDVLVFTNMNPDHRFIEHRAPKVVVVLRYVCCIVAKSIERLGGGGGAG